MEGFVRQIWNDLTHSNRFLEKKQKQNIGVYFKSENILVISL